MKVTRNMTGTPTGVKCYIKWAYLETRSLLAICSAADIVDELRKTKRSRDVDELISARLKDVGIDRDSDQVELKLHRLTEKYHEVKASTNNSRIRRKWVFFSDMDRIFNSVVRNVKQDGLKTPVVEPKRENASTSREMTRKRVAQPPQRKQPTQDDKDNDDNGIKTENNYDSVKAILEFEEKRCKMEDEREERREREEREHELRILQMFMDTQVQIIHQLKQQK